MKHLLAVAATAISLCAAPAAAAEVEAPSSLPETGARQRPAWLGVMLEQRGDGEVLAKRVLGGSPAAKAGLRAGDVIHKLDGQAMRAAREVTEAVSSRAVGQSVPLSIVRGKQRLTLTARLEERPDQEQVMRRDLVGRPLPSLSVQPLGAAPTGPAALRGKVFLVEVWELWCGACRYAMPQLDKLRREHAAAGFEVIGLTPDEAEPVLEVVQRHGVSYPQWRDPSGELQATLGVYALPTMLLVDRRGVVREAFTGVPEMGWLSTRVQELLSEGKKP